MKKILKRHKFLWIITVLAGLTITFLNVGVAYIIGAVIDTISAGNMNALIRIGVYGLVLLVSYIIMGNLYAYLSAKFNHAVLTDTKSTLIRNIFDAPIYKYQKNEVSYYYNILTQDMDQIKENYINKSYETVVALGGLIISLGALLYINIKMTLFFLVLMVIVTLIPRIFVGLQTKVVSEFSENYEGYVEELENVLSGFESIKLLNITESLYKKILNRDESMEDSRMKKSVTEGFLLYTITGISFFSQIGCMIVGAAFAIRGEITTGMLLAAIQMLNFVFPPIRQISANRNLMKANKVIRDKVAPYLITQKESGESMKLGAIKLKNYSLSFGEKEVLKDLNLVFEPNKSYVVIGPSGSGKSVLAKSVAGYFENYDGHIEYGGIEGKNLKPSELQKHVRYIGANSFVLNDNIKENIRMYRDISDEKVENIAMKVGFDKNFIEKESLGHSGKYISSGEYQRISIARALLDKPFCLILDEPTANLDPENAKAILELITEIDIPIKILITHDYTDKYLKTFDDVINFNDIK